jgi:plastocyanin
MRFPALLALCLLIPACGDDTGGPSDPIPGTAGVAVGEIFFRSDRNGTQDPAVDTIAVNGTVSWAWVPGSGLHSIRPTGGTFTGSAELMGQGSRHEVTFSTPGTYEYDCGVHGRDMSGRIVVR